MAIDDNNFDKAYEAVQRGANVNTTCSAKMGFTPLFIAILAATPNYPEPASFWARDTRLDIVNALLEAGANVNAKDRGGMTPLIFAQSVDNDDRLVARLLKAGSDPKAQDSNGKTAQDWVTDPNRFISATACKFLLADEFLHLAKERKKQAIKESVEAEK
jgi:ankyrin repeat protein